MMTLHCRLAVLLKSGSLALYPFYASNILRDKRGVINVLITVINHKRFLPPIPDSLEYASVNPLSFMPEACKQRKPLELIGCD